MNYENFETLAFDTSNKKLREDLSGKVSFKSLLHNYSTVERIKKTVRKESPQLINIFVTSGYSVLRDIWILRSLSKFKIPTIVHFHSKTCGEFILKPKRLKWLGRCFDKYARGIVLLSKYHLDFFKDYFPKEKCVIVENFVDYSKFDNVIDSKSIDFLFVGRLSKKKGFFDLLEAVNLLKKKGVCFKVNVIGLAVKSSEEKSINQYIDKNNLRNYFVFHGAVFGEKKFNLFRQSKLLLFPSHFENSPVVLKEGIAAKMGILASNITANLIILKGNNNFLLHEVKNSIHLAKQMEIGLKDTALINQMCHDSSEIKKFDKSIAQEKITKLFKSVI
ncbi:glycosyltransferase family 4 protein [Winogradskyella ursingii]|uniref:glycosyltransferase family 4 protein n=1 Tax=Winogradskyella ursingii TaxID=2686079 RepID=UPI0015C9EAA0|nr:glycosyltransferase family 4 protein [Winogradskyella ursingii]